MENNTLVERVRSEFIEMPGLRLTPAQAARLWGMDDASCQHVISALVRVRIPSLDARRDGGAVAIGDVGDQGQGSGIGKSRVRWKRDGYAVVRGRPEGT